LFVRVRRFWGKTKEFFVRHFKKNTRERTNALFSMAEHLASIFGTEKDRVNCPFYFKVLRETRTSVSSSSSFEERVCLSWGKISRISLLRSSSDASSLRVLFCALARVASNAYCSSSSSLFSAVAVRTCSR